MCPTVRKLLHCDVAASQCKHHDTVTAPVWSLYRNRKCKGLSLQTKQSGEHLLSNSVPRGQTVPTGNLEISKQEDK